MKNLKFGLVALYFFLGTSIFCAVEEDLSVKIHDALHMEDFVEGEDVALSFEKALRNMQREVLLAQIQQEEINRLEKEFALKRMKEYLITLGVDAIAIGLIEYFKPSWLQNPRATIAGMLVGSILSVYLRHHYWEKENYFPQY